MEDLVTAVLRSTDLSSEQLQIWVVDDQLQMTPGAQHLQRHWEDPWLRILPGQPRPTNQIWVSKNWAYTQAVQ